MNSDKGSKEQRAAYQRAWRLRNVERNRGIEKERKRKNHAKVRACAKAHYERNKAKIRADRKAEREADPWRALMTAKANSANRRYPGHVTVLEVAIVFERGNRTCCWCGKTELSGRDLTLEHLKPVNDVQYLAVACSACNIARIQTRGPRKSQALQRINAREKLALWRQTHREEYRAQRSARWLRRSEAKRVARRIYMRDYMRKRMAAKRLAVIVEA